MFQISRLTSCWDYLKHFFLRSNDFDPLIFLLQHLYLSLFREFPYSSIVLIAAIISIPMTQRNYFFHAGVFILPNLPKILSFINLLFGIICCNQYWKVLLFVYSLANFLTFQYEPSWNLINIITLMVYIYIIYTRLVFKNIDANVKYFVGFFCIAVVYTINFAFICLGVEAAEYFEVYVVLVLIGIFASHSMIQKRLWDLVNSSLENLTSGSEIINYIELILTRAKQNPIGLYETHRSNCKYPGCFCKSKQNQGPQQYISFIQQLVISIYKESMIKFHSGYFHDYIYHAYLQYLNKEKMFFQALQNLIIFKTYSKSIFNSIKEQRVSISIAQHFKTNQNETESYHTTIDINECFQYQKKVQELKKRIIELIHIKTEFWEEIIRPHSKVVVLKSLGSSFLRKLNQLDSYYEKEIRVLETEMMSSVGGMIFNLFLLTVTNYKEHAEANLKVLKKWTSKRGNVKMYLFGIIKVSLNKARLGTIEDINNTALKLLNINSKKYQSLGKSIDFMIPQSYKELHHKGMLKLNKSSQSSMIGNQVDLIPVVTATKTTLPCSLIFKYSNNITSQLSLITIIKYYRNNSQFVLLNSNDEIELLSSPKFDQNIIKLKEVQSIIHNFKGKWGGVKEGERYPITQPIQIHFKHNYTNYICTISSPLCIYFTCPNKPPLHLFFSNGNSTIQQHQFHEIQNTAIQKFKHILDHQSQSQTLANGKKQEIIDVLENFKKNSSLRLFNYYYPVVIIIAVLGILFITVEVMLIKIDWLNMDDSNSNVFELLNTHYNIQYSMLQCISKGLSVYGISHGYLTNGKYSETYKVPDYLGDTFGSIFNICQGFKQLYLAQTSQNSVVQNSNYLQYKQKSVEVDTATSHQTVPFYLLISVFEANCYDLASKTPIQSTILNSILRNILFQAHKDLRQYLKSHLFNKLSQSNTLNYPILILMISIFIFCLLFVYFGNKRIQKQEDYVFQLITSIPLNYILQEINILNLFDLSLKSNSFFNSLENGENEAVLTESENMRLVRENSKKYEKRVKNNELDNGGSKKPRPVFYLIVGIFILFLIGIIVIKNREIDTLTGEFRRVIQLKESRNQRLNLLVHVKKYLFEFKSEESQDMYQYIIDELKWRKEHYILQDQDSKVEYSCSPQTPVCLNNTLSQQSINIYFQQIITSTFLLKSVKNLPIQELLEETSNTMMENRLSIWKQRLHDKVEYYFDTGIILLIAAWVFFLFLLIMIIVYIKNLKAEYVRLTMFVSLLNEEMITKNKRVESFISRLGTHQQ